MEKVDDVWYDTASNLAWHSVHNMLETLREMYMNTNLLESMQKCEKLIGELENLIHGYMHWTQFYEIEHGEDTEVTIANRKLFEEAERRFGPPDLSLLD